jgi:hypothetical protein
MKKLSDVYGNRTNKKKKFDETQLLRNKGSF